MNSWPQAGSLTIEVQADGEAAVVVLTGDLDAASTPRLARRLDALLDSGPRRLAFDLAGVVFMDCAAARLLVASGNRLPDGTRPVLRSPGPLPRRVLELTGLDQHCQIIPARRTSAR